MLPPPDWDITHTRTRTHTCTRTYTHSRTCTRTRSSSWLNDPMPLLCLRLGAIHDFLDLERLPLL